MASTLHKQDANTSIQMQGSIQAQDALPTALLQGEQNAVTLQLKRKQSRGEPINNLFIGIALILVAVGTLVWVLNITDTIQGPWSSVCAALFTSIVTFIAILQLYMQFAIKPTSTVKTTHLRSATRPPDGDASLPRPSGQEGVVVVCRREMTAKITIDSGNVITIDWH
jgi:hypothetical protein